MHTVPAGWWQDMYTTGWSDMQLLHAHCARRVWWQGMYTTSAGGSRNYGQLGSWSSSSSASLRLLPLAGGGRSAAAACAPAPAAVPPKCSTRTFTTEF